METLFRSFRTQLEHTSTEVVRFLHDQIAWDSRLVAILGARGVGKTTLLLQHIKLYDREDESLYVTADDFYFTKYRLFGKVEFPYKEARPLKLFNDYLSTGYYPFFQDTEYLLRLRSVINQMVESDIPIFADMTVASAVKLKKLLYVLAQSVPFKPNYTKLARDLDISRNVLPDYMSYLEKAGLVNLLREKAQGLKLLEKVEKIYLNNTNLAYALSEQVPDIGSVRETVFLSWMRVVCFVTSSAISDFEIDGRTFEIGGKNKTRQQIKQAADGYVVKDDIEYAFRNMIPLWMFGFIY